MIEHICDMSFFRKHYDDYKPTNPDDSLLCTYLNLYDLYASSENLKTDVDKRLEKTLKDNAFPRMMKHEIIIWEPEYELIRRAYPRIRFGRILHNRSERDLLPVSQHISEEGQKITEDAKKWVVKFSETAQERKAEQKEAFEKLQKEIKIKISNKGFDDNVSRKSTRSDVVGWLKRRILNYAKEESGYISGGVEIDLEKLEIEKNCELFIEVFTTYILNPDGKFTPGPNDHVDLLTLMYVTPDRKILMDDKRWSEIADSVGLGHYFGILNGS